MLPWPSHTQWVQRKIQYAWKTTSRNVVTSGAAHPEKVYLKLPLETKTHRRNPLWSDLLRIDSGRRFHTGGLHLIDEVFGRDFVLFKISIREHRKAYHPGPLKGSWPLLPNMSSVDPDLPAQNPVVFVQSRPILARAPISCLHKGSISGDLRPIVTTFLIISKGLRRS